LILTTLLAITIDQEFWEDAGIVAARIVATLVIAFVLVRLLGHLINPALRVAIQEQMKDQPQEEIEARIDTLSHVLYRTALMVAFAVALIIILSEIGVNAAPLIASLGLFGLAVGFGAQSLVKDVINGIFILIDNQYTKGDVVTIAGTTGIVEDINLRRTILRDLDGTVHFVPHSMVETASNWTMEYARLHMDVGVAYESNLDHVISVINRVGKEMAEDPAYAAKFRTPPQVLRVDNFGDSSIDIKILGDTVPLEQWALGGQFRIRLKKAFDEEGIVIPYPQRTLHLDTAAALASILEKQGGGSGNGVHAQADGKTSAKGGAEPQAETRALDDSPDSPDGDS
jgi:small-conductance mechanosensitive channel